MQEEVTQLINASIQTAHIEVQMEGNHCNVLIVSSEFEGLTPVKKQQLVYACLNEKIASGEIHAVNIRALTPAQWQQ